MGMEDLNPEIIAMSTIWVTILLIKGLIYPFILNIQ